MPELPEVETVVRSLRGKLEGARVARVWTSGLPLRLGRPIDTRALRRLSHGACVTAIRRRAKYILVNVRTDRDEPAGWLIHLGMSGRLRLHDAREPRVRHTHVVWELEDRRELRFSDPRRFGMVRTARSIDGLPELAGLGPDPLAELDEAFLRRELATSRAPIKSFLLDQKRIAGLGNIYVCEALFEAGIHPRAKASDVRGRAPALLAAIRHVLMDAIENRGTTLRDFVASDGGQGTHQDALGVYGRAELPCPRCRAPIRRRIDGGRSTFFCARCQKR